MKTDRSIPLNEQRVTLGHLRRILTSLAQKRTWCKGRSTDIDDDGTIARCADAWVSHHAKGWTTRYRVLQALKPFLPTVINTTTLAPMPLGSLIMFNDDPKTTLTDVRHLFQRAALRVERNIAARTR